jgi:hypothetical protein
MHNRVSIRTDRRELGARSRSSPRSVHTRVPVVSYPNVRCVVQDESVGQKSRRLTAIDPDRNEFLKTLAERDKVVNDLLLPHVDSTFAAELALVSGPRRQCATWTAR